MFEEMKYWLLLFVPSVILSSSLYWMGTVPRVIPTFNSVCVRVHPCAPLCLTVSLLLQWLFITSSIVFTCLSLAFVTADFVSYSPITHTLAGHAHGLSVPLSDSSFSASVLSRFPSFIHWFIHLTNRKWTPLMFKLWSWEILGHTKMNQTILLKKNFI